MGKISLGCQDRAVLAAGVVSALGIDINQTNINQTTTWRKGQQARLDKSKDIMETHDCPEKFRKLLGIPQLVG